MRRIEYLIIVGLFLMYFLNSCLKEEVVPDPTVNAINFFVTDNNGIDQPVSQPTHGEKVKIVVETDADICSVWPGGVREIRQKSAGGDSIDIFGNPVLIKSDWYSDYGLVGAEGYKTTLSEDGWYFSYTYENAGEYDLTVILTNHGYDGPDYKQVVYEAGKITVN